MRPLAPPGSGRPEFVSEVSSHMPNLVYAQSGGLGCGIVQPTGRHRVRTNAPWREAAGVPESASRIYFADIRFETSEGRRDLLWSGVISLRVHSSVHS